MTILQTQGLKKIYGSGDTAVRALDGVDLSVENGEFVAIVGTSGSGKSTLLHMLGGLDRPTEGRVLVNGQNIFALKDEALTIFRRRHIGFVFQSYNLAPMLSVQENILLPLRLDGAKADEAYIGEIISALGLSNRLKSLPNQLSGGQQQRVAIARALATKPAIALTAMLFTSLFTIAFSVNDGIQQSTFRQVGGFSHGGFKYLTQAQYLALKDDPRIAQYGLRRFLGMPTEPPFHKAHVEVGYSDAAQAHWMFCDPVRGRLPREGTDEAATDTRVLALLGVTPELGAEFTVTFSVDGKETTQRFTLCGWWEYDEAVIASHILIPESRVDAVLQEVGVTPPGSDGMTGSWNLDVMLRSGARRIADDLEQILHDHGLQSDSRSEEGFVAAGVNWAYTGAQLSDRLDPVTLALVAGMLVLILLTGYLVIYNVFQISVAGDIRFYGLLKTIGTTPRQLRRIIRVQALGLSAAGIPVGLLAGWGLGGVLTPVITARLSGLAAVTSANPLLFAGSALFALATVFLSCRRPGRMAARVSPIEAVRYTVGQSDFGGKRTRRAGGRGSLLSMAWANLGRSRGKTAVTVLSLSLSVVLLTVTVTFGLSFDMEKYLANFVTSDFLLAGAGQIQTNGQLFDEELAVPEAAVDAVRAQGGVTESGRIYGASGVVQEFVTEAYYRASSSRWSTPEQLDASVAFQERAADGRLAVSA